MAAFSIPWNTLSQIAARAHDLDLPVTMDVGEVVAHLLVIDAAPGEGGWSHSGVYLAEGTPLRFGYLDHRFDGVVRDGLLEFGEIREESPSKAAALSIQQRENKATSINGWTTITAEVSAGGARRWQKLSELRRLAQEGPRRS